MSVTPDIVSINHHIVFRKGESVVYLDKKQGPLTCTIVDVDTSTNEPFYTILHPSGHERQTTLDRLRPIGSTTLKKRTGDQDQREEESRKKIIVENTTHRRNETECRGTEYSQDTLLTRDVHSRHRSDSRRRSSIRQRSKRSEITKNRNSSTGTGKYNTRLYSKNLRLSSKSRQ